MTLLIEDRFSHAQKIFMEPYHILSRSIIFLIYHSIIFALDDLQLMSLL